MNLGWMEIALIAGIALLFFGPSRLPNLGQSLGQAIRGFKKGITEDVTDEARDVQSQISQEPGTKAKEEKSKNTSLADKHRPS